MRVDNESASIRPDRAALRAELLAVGRRWAGSQVRLVRLAVELDDSGEWAFDGAVTCAHWIATALDIEVSTAREWVRVGRALADLPITNSAFELGRLSFTKARSVTRIATADSDAELCALAERTPAGKLATALSAWSARYDDPDERGRRQERERSLRWRDEPDGMVSVTMRLTPLQAGVFKSIIDAEVMRQAKVFRDAAPADAASEAAGDADGEAPGDTTESERDATGSRDSHGTRVPGCSPRVWSTMAQQRADAMISAITSGGSEVTSEVIIHVRGDGVAFDDGTPIAGSIVERIAGSGALRVMIHDAERRPINASGRHRHPTERQQRVVKERDRSCLDCGSIEFLQCDHDPAFEVSRRTLVDELWLRCTRCHRLRHQRDAL